jgi:hypothetical protein
LRLKPTVRLENYYRRDSEEEEEEEERRRRRLELQMCLSIY